MKIIKPPKSKKTDYSPDQSESDIVSSGSSSFQSESSKLNGRADKSWRSKPDSHKRSLANKSSAALGHKKSIIDASIEHYSGSDIDIFTDDESWDKVEYSRTNTDLSRFKKKSKRSVVPESTDPDGDGFASQSKPKITINKRALSKTVFSQPKSKKSKKKVVEYQQSEPLVNGKKRRRSELESTQGPSALEQLIDPDKKEFNSVLARGMRLLAIREHSVLEISNKLIAKFEDVDACTVYAVVDELVKLKYVSDDRFAESYVRARSNKGFGPVKIKAELKAKGVSNSLVQDHLKHDSGMWFDNAERQYQKKYGDGSVTDYNTWTKRARFMQSRGFTMEHIHVTLPKVEFD